ncbi:hypothetical protein [Kitasatospora fiedleri]|uniref:hypothetical protein n=1 Tax=Kitasatospora fiedleri TaxID=2991545 RepID=UPI000CA6EE48|nr:hypothetical protein [Kitasatospora fiedleri]
MRTRTTVGAALAAALIVGITAPNAMAGGNWDYGVSRTALTNGELYTSLSPENGGPFMPDGGLYWKVTDSYVKHSGGTITARFGVNWNGLSFEKGLFTQSSGTTSSATWTEMGFTDCHDIVGWIAVTGQNTFYNAPVTIC